MPVTDPISDLLTRIRNASLAYHETLDLDHSKLKMEVLRVLLQEGFIRGFERLDDGKFPRIKVTLKYGPRRERVITRIRSVSTPGLRVYRRAHRLPRVLGGLGIAIVTTPDGVMTDREARRRHVGGEVLAEVW